MGDAARFAQRAQAAAGMTSRRRARAPLRGGVPQSSVEEALARAAVSGEQSEGRFEESKSTDARRHRSHVQRSVYHAASASRRRYGEPAASESAAARTNAVTQPSAEAALA